MVNVSLFGQILTRLDRYSFKKIAAADLYHHISRSNKNTPFLGGIYRLDD